MGHGGDRLGGSQASTQSAILRSQSALAAVKRLRGAAKRIGGPVLDVARACGVDASPGLLVVGAKPKPGGQMLLAGKASHVQAALTDHRLGGNGIDTLDTSEVDAADAVQFTA